MSSSEPSSPRRTRRRGPSQRKRRQILNAAREVFHEDGFAGASMDAVATRAGVSKQTVYAHFTDKTTLFVELVSLDVGGGDGPAHPLEEAMPRTDDLEHDLAEYARWFLAEVLQPERMRLRRMIIGEAERFPDLARAWFESGPVRSSHVFATWFAALDRRGLLDVPDPELAGQQFNWLVLSIPLNRAMADASDAALPERDEIRRLAEEAVRIFLSAYRAPSERARP